MATGTMAPAARSRTAHAVTAHRSARLAHPIEAIYFDGRDLNEPITTQLTTKGRPVALCSHCGTIRDARFAFCCEFAGFRPESQPAARPVRRAAKRGRPAAVSAA
jgi:hypothetical protein